MCIDFGVISTYLLILEEYRGLVSDESSRDIEVEVFNGLFFVHLVVSHEDLDCFPVGVDGHWVGELSSYSHEGAF